MHPPDDFLELVIGPLERVALDGSLYEPSSKHFEVFAAEASMASDERPIGEGDLEQSLELLVGGFALRTEGAVEEGNPAVNARECDALKVVCRQQDLDDAADMSEEGAANKRGTYRQHIGRTISQHDNGRHRLVV